MLNAQTETNDFIEDESATTDIMRYQPSIDEELQANKGDKAFDFIYDMLINLPTGEDVKKEVLIVFDGNIGSESAPKFKAWLCNATVTLNHFDSVAEKIYFSISINNKVVGNATVSAGVPTFEAGAAAALLFDEE